jgi:hypothetical protein
VFGAAGATGVAVAAVMLTQFLTSPAAQTTGASATPTAHVAGSSPAGAAWPTSHPPPSADATSTSVLASASPPPIQVLNQIQATSTRRPSRTKSWSSTIATRIMTMALAPTGRGGCSGAPRPARLWIRAGR